MHENSSLQTARKYLGEDVLYTNNNMDVIAASDAIAVTTQDRLIKDIAEEIFATS